MKKSFIFISLLCLISSPVFARIGIKVANPHSVTITTTGIDSTFKNNLISRLSLDRAHTVTAHIAGGDDVVLCGKGSLFSFEAAQTAELFRKRLEKAKNQNKFVLIYANGKISYCSHKLIISETEIDEIL